jgi:hypothetical protein
MRSRDRLNASGCLDVLLAQRGRGAADIDDMGPGGYFITGVRRAEA